MDIPVARRTSWLLLGVVLALLAAGGGDASANRLDKTACTDLNTELSGLLVPGLKEDMDKGPAWAAANLSPERLVTINKVIELQGVLEFRCGNPARNIAKPDMRPDDKAPAEKPGAAKAATTKPNADDSDEATPAKPTQKAKTVRRRRGSAANPEPSPVTPAAAQPVTVPAAPAVTTAKAAPETPVAAKPEPPPAKAAAAAALAAPSTAAVAPKVTPVSTAPTPPPAPEPSKSGAPAPVTASEATTTATGTPKTAKKKPSRRDSTSAYVSPSDVNTYGLSTGR
jgi:hypothetical protein